MTTAFCLAEDRRGAEIGLKLLVLTLAEFCPESPVVLFRPSSAHGFREWLERFPQVQLIEVALPGASNWNCKPHALLEVLRRHPEVDQVLWLDSDLILTRDIRSLFDGCDPAVMGVTQEPLSAAHQGTEIRTRGWGLPLGTVYQNTFNSCVVRVTRSHGSFLLRWRELLECEEYVRSSALPITAKPPHLWSDQDVLNALLGSQEGLGVSVRMLAHGKDVLHTGGALAFSLSERMAAVGQPLPTVLHAIGVKPWVLLNPDKVEKGLFAWFRRLLQETSPYVIHVRRYRDQVDEPMVWLDQWTVLGRAVNLVAFRNWALRGLPITIVCTLAASLRRLVRRVTGR